MPRGDIVHSTSEDPVPAKRRRKLESAGRSWRYSPELEAAVRLKASDPYAYSHLGPSIHIQVGHYLAGRTAAQAIGRDITEGGDAA